jgi:hypothetical protein
MLEVGLKRLEHLLSPLGYAARIFNPLME